MSHHVDGYRPPASRVDSSRRVLALWARCEADMSRALATIAGAYVGRRIELAPHREEWTRGDRYGTVLRVTMRGFVVKLDRSGRTIRGIRDGDIGHYLE